MSWLTQAKKGIRALASQKKEIPDNLWTKCPACGDVLYHKELARTFWVCTHCGHHLRISADRYLELLADPGSWRPTHEGIVSVDPLGFKDSKRYTDRLKESRKKTGHDDAILTGRCTVEQVPVCLGVMDFAFMGGSMGSVVGEKIARLLGDALQYREAAVIVSCSAGVPCVSILTHPTTGGVTASYAMLGDVILAEPGALIGFAGPRVIQQTINSELPEGFQSSEFLLEHGMIDAIVPRGKLKETLAAHLRWFTDGRDVSVREPFRG